jgi:hypothetical protein
MASRLIALAKTADICDSAIAYLRTSGTGRVGVASKLEIPRAKGVPVTRLVRTGAAPVRIASSLRANMISGRTDRTCSGADGEPHFDERFPHRCMCRQKKF